MSYQQGHSAQLPDEPIDLVVEPITRFVQIEAAAGVILLLFTVLALSLANSLFSEPEISSRSTQP